MLVLIHIPAEINIRINCPTDYGRSNCETYCLTEMEVSIVLREEFKNHLWSHLKKRTKAPSPSVSGKLATFWTKLFSWVYCSAEPLKVKFCANVHQLRGEGDILKTGSAYQGREKLLIISVKFHVLLNQNHKATMWKNVSPTSKA